MDSEVSEATRLRGVCRKRLFFFLFSLFFFFFFIFFFVLFFFFLFLTPLCARDPRADCSKEVGETGEETAEVSWRPPKRGFRRSNAIFHCRARKANLDGESENAEEVTVE
jgi:hypothetical protein